MRHIGTIKTWNLDRGFGLVIGKGGRLYFLHIHNWSEDDAPVVGALVEYEIETTPTRGKHRQAINACPAPSGATSAATSSMEVLS